jgi:hypothetical protein
LLGGVDNIIESWLAVLETSRDLSVDVVPQDDRLVIELTLQPGAEGAARLLHTELVTGPLEPLLTLPDSTGAALLLRGEESPRAEGAQNMGASLSRLFGERLAPEQTTKLVSAFEALDASRRGATVIGLVNEPVPALVMTFELAQSDAFPGALAAVLRLLELPPISSWLASTVGKPVLELPAASGGPRRARVRFQRSAARVPATLPAELHLVWEARDGVGYLVVSPDAKLGLAPIGAPSRLTSSTWLTQSQQRLGQRALGLFVDLRLVRPDATEPAPLLLTFGKQADRIAVSLDAAPAALHAAAGLFALELER